MTRTPNESVWLLAMSFLLAAVSIAVFIWLWVEPR